MREARQQVDREILSLDVYGYMLHYKLVSDCSASDEGGLIVKITLEKRVPRVRNSRRLSRARTKEVNSSGFNVAIASFLLVRPRPH